MNKPYSFQRMAAWTAVLAAPLAIGSNVLTLTAVDFNFDAFSNTLLLLQAGADGAALWRWSMILDMFGYYLLLTPLTLVLWRWLKPQNPEWVGLFTLCLLAYILIGAMGAAILATVIPPLMVAQAAATPGVEVVFTAFMDMVYGGLWNILEEFIAGIGWIGLGLTLRHQRRALGVTTIILGAAALTDSLSNMLGIEPLAVLALNIYLLLAPVWALWLGISLLRKPAPQQVFEPAVAQ